MRCRLIRMRRRIRTGGAAITTYNPDELVKAEHGVAAATRDQDFQCQSTGYQAMLGDLAHDSGRSALNILRNAAQCAAGASFQAYAAGGGETVRPLPD